MHVAAGQALTTSLKKGTVLLPAASVQAKPANPCQDRMRAKIIFE
jgi:hypothetical protein